MTENDAKEAEKRITKYRELAKLQRELCDALTRLTEPTSSSMPSPFTGNTRESRQVKSIIFHFTATRGGAEPCTREIHNLHLEAYAVGRELEAMLRSKIAEVNAEIYNL